MLHLADGTSPELKVFDCVSVDGRRGTALGFYAREERTVLIRLDAAGLIEVAESRVAFESPWIASAWSDERRHDEEAGRARYDALARAVERGTSPIHRR
jgi:hypothetical protein